MKFENEIITQWGTETGSTHVEGNLPQSGVFSLHPLNHSPPNIDTVLNWEFTTSFKISLFSAKHKMDMDSLKIFIILSTWRWQKQMILLITYNYQCNLMQFVGPSKVIIYYIFFFTLAQVYRDTLLLSMSIAKCSHLAQANRSVFLSTSKVVPTVTTKVMLQSTVAYIKFLKSSLHLKWS